MTFGNPFGLALYDKDQRCVTPARSRADAAPEPQKVEWVLVSASGEPLSTHDDPVDFCSAVRRVLEHVETAEEVMAFWRHNRETVAQLRNTARSA